MNDTASQLVAEIKKYYSSMSPSKRADLVEQTLANKRTGNRSPYSASGIAHAVGEMVTVGQERCNMVVVEERIMDGTVVTFAVDPMGNDVAAIEYVLIQ